MGVHLPHLLEHLVYKQPPSLTSQRAIPRPPHRFVGTLYTCIERDRCQPPPDHAKPPAGWSEVYYDPDIPFPYDQLVYTGTLRTFRSVKKRMVGLTLAYKAKVKRELVEANEEELCPAATEADQRSMEAWLKTSREQMESHKLEQHLVLES